MRRIFVLIFYLLVLGISRAAPIQATSSHVVSLAEAFAGAQKRSEIVANNAEQITQAEERHRQALASLYPNVSVVAAYTYLASGAELVTPRAQPLFRVNVTQPLFRGFREYATLRQAKILQEVQGHFKKQAERALLMDLISNFMTVVTIEREKANVLREINNLNERIRELNARVAIGRSRPTEVLTIRAAVATLRSEMAHLDGALSVTRDTFAFLTGMPKTSAVQFNVEGPIVLGELGLYLDRLTKRSEILAADLRIAAAEENITIVRGTHLPAVDFSGNYYARRTGALENVPWDINLTLSFPLYDGGLTNSRVTEAVSQKTEAELERQRFMRSAETEIASLYGTVDSDLKQLQEHTAAREISRQTVAQLQAEYRSGLVSNIEVLQATAVLDETLRTIDRLRIQSHQNYLKLQVASDQSPFLGSE